MPGSKVWQFCRSTHQLGPTSFGSFFSGTKDVLSSHPSALVLPCPHSTIPAPRVTCWRVPIPKVPPLNPHHSKTQQRGCWGITSTKVRKIQDRAHSSHIPAWWESMHFLEATKKPHHLSCSPESTQLFLHHFTTALRLPEMWRAPVFLKCLLFCAFLSPCPFFLSPWR